MNKITEQSRATIPTPTGDLEMVAFAENELQKMPHLAIIHPEMNPEEAVYLRIHSECLTGDIFHSLRCDCGDQLQKSLQIISQEKGIIIYLRQEGRGIGLIEKLKAYTLQDDGLNTYDANVALGHDPDERDYQVAIDILETLGIQQVKLLTNNPEKVSFLNHSKIEVIERIPLVIPPNDMNKDYYKTKKSMFKHYL